MPSGSLLDMDGFVRNVVGIQNLSETRLFRDVKQTSNKSTDEGRSLFEITAAVASAHTRPAPPSAHRPYRRASRGVARLCSSASPSVSGALAMRFFRTAPHGSRRGSARRAGGDGAASGKVVDMMAPFRLALRVLARTALATGPAPR